MFYEVDSFHLNIKCHGHCVFCYVSSFDLLLTLSVLITVTLYLRFADAELKIFLPIV